MATLGFACLASDIIHVWAIRCVGASTLSFAPKALSILMVVFETSSAILTTARCLIAFSSWSGLENQRRGIMVILLEQGILYFCTISIFTTAAVILNYRAPPGFFQRLPNAFTLPLSTILTARFILYLREWTDTALKSEEGVEDPSPFEVGSRSGPLSRMLAIEDFGVDPVALVAENFECGGRKYPPR